MTKLFLPKPDPYDDRYGYGRTDRHRGDLPPWEADVELANKIARSWVEQWFEVKEVAAWLEAWPEADPRVAAAFRAAGISPAAAVTRLWYGKVNPHRSSLAVRVAIDLTAEEAARQLRAAGLAGASPRPLDLGGGS